MVRRRLTIALLLLFASSLAALAAMGDWPSFRANTALTGTVPAFSDRPRLLWTHESKAAIEGSPAIAGDTVYIGTRGKTLLALSLTTGKPRWTFTASNGIAASPCIVGQTVYIGDEGGIMWALDTKTGKPRWKYQTGDKIISSVTPVNGAIFFGSYDYYLYKLNASTGKLIWRYQSQAQVHTTPCLTPDGVAIAGCDGYVRIIDLQRGKQKTAVSLEDNFGASPVYSAGCVFVGSMSGHYAAVRVRDSKVMWRTTKAADGGASFGSPALSGDYLIFPSRNKTVFCLKRGTGELRWVSTTRGQVDSSPAIAGNRVYFGSDDGTLYEVDLVTGRTVWHFKTGAGISGGPALARGRLVVGATDGAIYCFG